MMTVTTQPEESTAGAADRLLMAIELGRRQWNVGFTTQRGQRIRRRTLPANAWDRLPEEMAAAKKRLDLPVMRRSRAVTRQDGTASGFTGISSARVSTIWSWTRRVLRSIAAPGGRRRTPSI
jgi:hypothetical protein